MSFLNKEFHDRLYCGVKAIFCRWTAFKLAVEGGWGGNETEAKAEWFVETMTDYLFDENDSLELDFLEEILMEIMSAEFHVDLEDNSEKGIAKNLLTLYNELRNNKTGYYDALLTLKVPQAKAVDMTKEDSLDDED